MFEGITLPVVQLVSLPLIALLLARISIGGQKIPRLVLLIGFSAAALTAGSGYSTRLVDSESVLVARFTDDTLGTKSRIFRESLKRLMRGISTGRAQRYYNSFRSHEEVVKKFSGKENIHAVIWGNERWLNVSFPNASAFEVEKLLAEQVKSLTGFQLVSSVPIFGVARRPESETLRFLSDFFVGFLPTTVRGEVDGDRPALDEVVLTDSLLRSAPWSSYAHRAMPAWLLGNRYLEEAIGSSNYQPQSMKCAQEIYRRGFSFLRPGDNPELQGALLNNLGVALIVQAHFEGFGPDQRKQIKRFWQMAESTGGQRSLMGGGSNSWKIARANLRLLNKRGKPEAGSESAGVTVKPKKKGKGKKRHDAH